ncbi:MAG: hypothetical protein Q7V57_11065 [Actinomycetota bacterium]|nr:hypothetical protein [Actinomycetota bacterium]
MAFRTVGVADDLGNGLTGHVCESGSGDRLVTWYEVWCHHCGRVWDRDIESRPRIRTTALANCSYDPVDPEPADFPVAARNYFECYRSACHTCNVAPLSWVEWWARYGGRYMEVAAGGVAVTSPAVLDAAGAVEPLEGSDGGEAVAAAPAVLVAVEVSCVGDGPPEVAGADASAALIVSGGAPPVPPPVVPHLPGRCSPRSLRNEIAHALAERRWPAGFTVGGLSTLQLRHSLEDAQAAIETCSSYVLLFGPQALIDEVSR